MIGKVSIGVVGSTPVWGCDNVVGLSADGATDNVVGIATVCVSWVVTEIPMDDVPITVGRGTLEGVICPDPG